MVQPCDFQCGYFEVVGQEHEFGSLSSPLYLERHFSSPSLFMNCKSWAKTYFSEFMGSFYRSKTAGQIRSKNQRRQFLSLLWHLYWIFRRMSAATSDCLVINYLLKIREADQGLDQEMVVTIKWLRKLNLSSKIRWLTESFAPGKEIINCNLCGVGEVECTAGEDPWSNWTEWSCPEDWATLKHNRC